MKLLEMMITKVIISDVFIIIDIVMHLKNTSTSLSLLRDYSESVLCKLLSKLKRFLDYSQFSPQITLNLGNSYSKTRMIYFGVYLNRRYLNSY